MTRLTTVLILSLFLTPGFAADPDTAPEDTLAPLHGYDALDRDGDGQISYQEAEQAEALDLIQFEQTDQNGDRQISPEEYRQMMANMTDSAVQEPSAN